MIKEIAKEKVINIFNIDEIDSPFRKYFCYEEEDILGYFCIDIIYDKKNKPRNCTVYKAFYFSFQFIIIGFDFVPIPDEYVIVDSRLKDGRTPPRKITRLAPTSLKLLTLNT